MKDEAHGVLIQYFVGLILKRYTNKNKGDNVSTGLTFVGYVNCLRERRGLVAKQCTLRSYAHNIFSAFSLCDSKFRHVVLWVFYCGTNSIN